MKTSYRKIDEHRFDIYIINESNDSEDSIGYVYRNLTKGAKWKIHTYFMPLLDDHEKLYKRYTESIKAGRVLVRIWNRLKAAETHFDTQEYDMHNLFGAD